MQVVSASIGSLATLKVVPESYRAVLSHPRFRRYWAGETITAVGDAMSEITVIWLASELVSSNKGLAIALASIAYLVPGTISGVLLGRFLAGLDGRTLILIDCGLRFGFLGAIPVLHWLDHLTLPIYLVLLGFAALTRPLAEAGGRVFVRDLLPESDRFAANSLLGSVMQTSMILGPGAAGLLISVIGSANVLALDALTFALFGFILLTLPKSETTLETETSSQEASTGQDVPTRSFRDLLQLRTIVGLFVLTFFFHLLYGPLVVALPLKAPDLGESFGLSGSVVLGLLWTGFGIGAVFGGIIAGTRRSLASFVSAAAIVGLWGISTLVLGATSLLWVALGAMVFGGFVYAPYLAIVWTIMQRESPKETLARIGSYWSSMTGVASPSGTMLAGVLVPLVGTQFALLGSGAAMILISAFALIVVQSVSRRSGRSMTWE